jgi:hypothetical protein
LAGVQHRPELRSGAGIFVGVVVEALNKIQKQENQGLLKV